MGISDPGPLKDRVSILAGSSNGTAGSWPTMSTRINSSLFRKSGAFMEVRALICSGVKSLRDMLNEECSIFVRNTSLRF
jgi:hypothetical protein